MSEPSELDAALDVVAGTPNGPADLRQTLLNIIDIALTGVPGVDYASFTIRHGSGRLETMAPSSPLLYVADGLQYELNEGPSYDAVTDEGVVYGADLAHDSRWPNFGPKARTLGLSSLLAIRLAHPGPTTMALNLYSDAVGAFDDHQGVASLFSRPKGFDADSRNRALGLRDTLTSQVTVEQAIGILMNRHAIPAAAALDVLRELAAHRFRDQSS